jgi:hypothetical protein
LPKIFKDNQLDNENFICLGCNAQAIPCSYKPSNLRRPYYKILQHEQKCEIQEYQKFIKIGQKKKISSEDGFPVPYPSKLYLTNKNKKIISGNKEQKSENSKEIKNYKQHSENVSINTAHHRTSSTIRPIVKHFINFPYDRHLDLDIPMIKFNTYNSSFRKIYTYETSNEQFQEKYSIPRIYYGKLSLEKNSLIKNDNTIILKFLDKDKNITLKIDISNWSKRKINEVINEITDLQSIVKNQFSEELNKIMKKENKAYGEITSAERKKIKTNDIYIFFIGSLSHEKYTFELYNNDFRLYYAELI